MNHQTIISLALLSTFSSAVLAAEYQSKGSTGGSQKLVVNHKATTLWFAPRSSGNSSKALTDINSPGWQADVETGFRYGDANSNGRTHVLKNNSVLHSGDTFTVDITVNRKAYVYVYHTDCKEQNELISWSGYSNQLQAGQSISLPPKGEVFDLDNRVGKEYFYTIVSSQPYKLDTAAVKNAACFGLNFVPKGIGKRREKQPGRVVACPVNSIQCRDTFVIDHRA